MADSIMDTVMKLWRDGYSVIPSGRGDDGKAPRVSWRRFQNKQPEESTVRRWLRVMKPTLWGIVTNETVAVIDADTDEARSKLQADLGEPHVRTPRGGAHWYVDTRGHPLKTCTKIRPGVDVRGEGGFVNILGKNPVTGGEYQVLRLPFQKDIIPFHRLPEWLKSAIKDERKENASEPASTASKFEPGTPIVEGERNSTLMSLAGSMRRRGMTQDAIEAALLVENQKRCQPPLEEKEVRKTAESAARYPPKPYHRTDLGNAQLMADLYGDKLRYDHKRGKWLVWGDHHWEPDPDRHASRLACEAAERRYLDAMSIEDPKLRDLETKWARASESRQRIDACLSLASTLKPLTDSGEGWDTDTMLLGCENGSVNLRTGKLRPGRPEDRITMTTGLDFDPAAECPRWMTFLEEVFESNRELTDWVWRALGYSITGDCTEGCFWVGFGTGANGKSRFAKAVSGALGDYAHASPFSTFARDRPSSNTNDLMMLDKRRFVTSSEVNEGTHLNLERIKALTGEDLITARPLYREFVTFQPVSKIWLFVNHLPEIDDDSIATWRRIRPIPFARTFVRGDEDPRLGEKLKAEAQGILAWLVRGCLEWQKRGLKAPDCVRVSAKEYRHETDPVARFIDDCCVTGEGEEVRAGKFYEAYTLWAKDYVEPHRILNITNFGRKMGKMYERGSDNMGNYYEGVGLRRQEGVYIRVNLD